MTKTNGVTHWIEQVKGGDSRAAEQIWEHYFERLVRSVRRRMQGQNRAARDEEDVALSVFDSFYDAAQQGRFPDLADRDDLWHLLLRMAARKVVDKRRRDQRVRRGGKVDVSSLQATDNSDDRFMDVIGNDPSPEMVLMTQETIERFFSHLGVGQLRALAGAKLEGYSNAEMADHFGCSERTIERRLHLIRQKCQQEMNASDEHSSKKPTGRGSAADR